MPSVDERRYAISEVSEQTRVSAHVLRRWEGLFPQLNPGRNRANRRYYTQADIEIVRRIKYLLWHEKMTTEGARRALAEELHGEGKPRTRKQALELIRKIESEARAMLDLLDSDASSRSG